MVKYRIIVIKLPSSDMAKVTPDCCGFLYINHLNLILIYSLRINGVSLTFKTRPLKRGEGAAVRRACFARCNIATGASSEDFLLPQQIGKLSHWGNDFTLN